VVIFHIIGVSRCISATAPRAYIGFMNPLLILLQVTTVALLGWGAWLCFAKRDRRMRERRRFARGGRAGRRRGDLSEAQAAAQADRDAPAQEDVVSALPLRVAGK
jgi:hypothetical protein